MSDEIANINNIKKSTIDKIGITWIIENRVIPFDETVNKVKVFKLIINNYFSKSIMNKYLERIDNAILKIDDEKPAKETKKAEVSKEKEVAKKETIKEETSSSTAIAVYNLDYPEKTKIIDKSIKRTNTDCVKAIKKILENLGLKSAHEEDAKRENANVDGDTAMGTMLQFGSTVSKEFAKAYLMKKKFAEAHDNGDIHIHDMDFAPTGTTTCTQIDLLRLFKDGFATGHGALREPQDISS